MKNPHSCAIILKIKLIATDMYNFGALITNGVFAHARYDDSFRQDHPTYNPANNEG